jgi:hypothetical protein
MTNKESLLPIRTYCWIWLSDNMKDNPGYILNRKILPCHHKGQKVLYLVAHPFGIDWYANVKTAEPEQIDKTSLNLPNPIDLNYRNLPFEDTQPEHGNYCYGWKYVGIDYRN